MEINQIEAVPDGRFRVTWWNVSGIIRKVYSTK